jgi:hypothetical protein
MKAIQVVYAYFQRLNPDVEADELQDAIGEFAELLVKNNAFIYKGTETARVSPTLLRFRFSATFLF